MDEGENPVLGGVRKGLGSHEVSSWTVKEGSCIARGMTRGEGIKECVDPALTKFGIKA